MKNQWSRLLFPRFSPVFQLHPTFWMGMAPCDTQSAPDPGPGTQPCIPDSDANIYDSADPGSPHYIGKHTGTALMEMQFYPPGWVPWPPGISCDAGATPSLAMRQMAESE